MPSTLWFITSSQFKKILVYFLLITLEIDIELFAQKKYLIITSKINLSLKSINFHFLLLKRWILELKNLLTLFIILFTVDLHHTRTSILFVQKKLNPLKKGILRKITQWETLKKEPLTEKILMKKLKFKTFVKTWKQH